MISRPRGRDLERPELDDLVAGLAGRPDLWAHRVRHDPVERVYEELVRDHHLAVWLICWMDDHDTGFHDHDRSAGAVAVTRGAVIEDRLLLGGGTTSRTVDAGGTFTFAASDIHRVRHGGAGPRSASTRTRRRCGAWARTRSAPAASCAGIRSPTPRSCARSPRPSPDASRRGAALRRPAAAAASPASATAR